VARIWWNICRSFKSDMLFQHSSYKAHTHQLWKSQWIHFKTQASSWCDGPLQRLHRQSTPGGTSLGHATGTWFNQLIPSTLLYFITSTNTSSFLLTSNPRLTRLITACRVLVCCMNDDERVILILHSSTHFLVQPGCFRACLASKAFARNWQQKHFWLLEISWFFLVIHYHWICWACLNGFAGSGDQFPEKT
jgi:hypothetical protein